MTAKDEELMKDISRADPAWADLPPAKGSTRYNSILEASMRHERTDERHPATVPTTHDRSTTKARRRRRLIWQGALVAGAAVIVLAVLSIVNVFGANGPSIVEKASAALNPTKNVILHVKISGTESLKGDTSSWTEESWSRMTSPYTRRDIQAFPGQPVLETVQDTTGLAQMYDAAGNTIYTQAAASEFRVAAGQAVPYGEMILELLNSGDAVVDGKDTIDGREVIRIAATKDYGTAPDGTKYGDWFYVDPDTNYPVEWRQTRDGGKVVDIHFDAYELLPANDESLALLDLSAQHPAAAVSATSLEDYRNSQNETAPQPDGDPSIKQDPSIK